MGSDFEERLSQLETYYGSGKGAAFGLNLEAFGKAAHLFAFLHRMYFRTEVHGIDRVPKGRVLIVANHSGQLPIDAVILGCSLFFDTAEPRVVRAMIDRWAAGLPFVASFFGRLGSVVGAPDNARMLLEREEALLVFPEGVRGISKPFQKRYELQEFGTGFMRIALETHAPILPVAVIGAEEQYINLGNSELGAKVLGAPVFPVVPQWLMPLGTLPLPTKYRLHFGEPLHFTGSPDDDPEVIADKVFLVKQAIQSLLTCGLKQRRGVFF
jgi:1-acyl-sn-glycerol-3-phosphate acyltransferase